MKTGDKIIIQGEDLQYLGRVEIQFRRGKKGNRGESANIDYTSVSVGLYSKQNELLIFRRIPLV